MKATTFSTEAEALALIEAIDALTGCPSPDGLTLHYTWHTQHPDTGEWAVYVDDTVDGLLAREDTAPDVLAAVAAAAPAPEGGVDLGGGKGGLITPGGATTASSTAALAVVELTDDWFPVATVVV